MMEFIEPLQKLIDQFRKLPGIGGKTAIRLAFSVLNMPRERAEEFSSAILYAKENVHSCVRCGNISAHDLCPICSDERRNSHLLCVVEDAKDVMSFERIREFHGRYHVLGGVLSPIDGIGPDNLRIVSLLDRIQEEDVEEVVLATNPTVEGEATALYISRLLQPFDVKVSRLAYGVPVGADLEYADEMTLDRALEGRRPMNS